MALIQPAERAAGVTVGAIAARDRSTAESFAKKHRIHRVHDSYADLIDDPELDAIYNPLPNGLHGTWSMRALRAGKDVLCEKPLAANAGEAIEMVECAQRTGRRLIEAFHYRYHRLVEELREIIAGGIIGEVEHYQASFVVPIIRSSDIRYSYDLAGGAMMDLGCYAVHLIRSLAAAEPRVERARCVERPAKIDRTMEADLVFADGRSAEILCSMWSPKILRADARIVGDRGVIRVLNFVAPHLYHSIKIETAGGTATRKVGGPSTYTAQLDAFAVAVRTGQPAITEGRDCIDNMKVIDAVYEAAGLPLRQPAPSAASG